VRVVKYPVRSEAIREIQEEVAKSKLARRKMKTLKPVFIDTKYYEFLKGSGERSPN